MGAFAVALAASVFALTGWRQRDPNVPWFVVCGATFIAFLVPLGDLSLAAYSRGLIGDLSVTSMVLLIARLLALAGGNKLGNGERTAVFACVLTSGIVLYPMALGLTAFDPYALGFGSAGLLYVLGLFALAAVLFGLKLLPITLVLAATAFAFELGDSTNLWDYWIDPWLFFYAVWFRVRKITFFVPVSKFR